MTSSTFNSARQKLGEEYDKRTRPPCPPFEEAANAFAESAKTWEEFEIVFRVDEGYDKAWKHPTALRWLSLAKNFDEASTVLNTVQCGLSREETLPTLARFANTEAQLVYVLRKSTSGSDIEAQMLQKLRALWSKSAT